MEMEILEEFSGSKDHDQKQIIIKGRRSKRPRPSSPFGLAVTSSSSTGGGDVGGSGSGGSGDVYSATTSDGISASASTDEDEDMANCLILLAQGGGFAKRVEQDEENKNEKFNSRRFTEMAATTTAKAGFFVYACKTCNRTFPSFQALGGHRASHKKPKVVHEEKNAPAAIMPLVDDFQDQEVQFNKMGNPSSPPISSAQIAQKDFLGNNNSKPKIHECSICGSEFSSGQALGGHMRRHRTPTSTTSSKITMNFETSTTENNSSHDGEKTRNILPLDLNLPAPEDDLRDTKFQFSTTQQHLVFSAPALVDCHY